MRSKNYFIFIFTLIILIGCCKDDPKPTPIPTPTPQPNNQDGLIYVGIPKENLNYFAAAQKNSNWCWAASLQLIFNYYGINISQEQIVQRSYGMNPNGTLPDYAGSIQIITANLNNWSIDNNGVQYVVKANLYSGAPIPNYLINELSQQRPVLIGYNTGSSTGHAVVATACSYITTPSGPSIQSIIVRDPYPTPENKANLGRIEYPAFDFASRIQNYWYTRVTR